jgi:hypothetical protein
VANILSQVYLAIGRRNSYNIIVKIFLGETIAFNSFRTFYTDFLRPIAILVNAIKILFDKITNGSGIHQL